LTGLGGGKKREVEKKGKLKKMPSIFQVPKNFARSVFQRIKGESQRTKPFGKQRKQKKR